MSKLGVCKSLGRVTTTQMTQTNQRDISHRTTPYLAKKRSGAMFRYFICFLFENWLGINLPMGGGEWWPFHHLLFHFFCFFFQFSFPRFCSSFSLLCLTGNRGGWGRWENELLCGAALPPGITTKCLHTLVPQLGEAADICPSSGMAKELSSK